MHWLLACGDLDMPIDNTPQLMVWGHMTLYSSAVLFLQAPVMAFFLRSSGTPFWRRKAVLLPASLGLLGGLAFWLVVGRGGVDTASDEVVHALALLAIACVLIALVS